jgi:hypothetical protein
MQLSSHLNARRKGDGTSLEAAGPVDVILSGKASGGKPCGDDSWLTIDRFRGSGAKEEKP